MSNISADKVYVKELFSNTYYYEIPEYQRPYSWQEDNCGQLFDDLWEANRENDYFLGTLILQKMFPVGTGAKYNIIDGQQRVTTLQILLACLRDTVEETRYKDTVQKRIYQEENICDATPEQFRLIVKDYEFFKSHVQEMQGTNCYLEKIDVRNESQRNIVTAIKVFRNRIMELQQAQIIELIRFIQTKCLNIVVVTEDFSDAYRLFTIINDRGMQLRRIDILKCINLDPNVIKSDELRREYAKKWEEMENDLSDGSELSNEFEQLVSLVRTIEIKEKPKEDILSEFNKLFANGSLVKGTQFIDYLKEYKEIYDKIILERDIDLKEQTEEYRNLIYIMKNYLPFNEWISAVLMYYKKYKKENLYNFLLKLENKVVADWIIALTPTKRTVNLCSILKDISASKTSYIYYILLELQEDQKGLCRRQSMYVAI